MEATAFHINDLRFGKAAILKNVLLKYAFTCQARVSDSFQQKKTDYDR